MSTDTNPAPSAPEGQSSIVTPPANPQPAAPAAPQPEPPKPGAKVEIPSDELKRRLDETRTKAASEARADLLKSLGIADETALKGIVDNHKKLEDEKRTDLEKRDARIKDLEPKAIRADALEAVVKRQVETGLASLNETQREAVKRLAGDDPLKQLDAIEVFKSALPAAPIAPANPATPAPPAVPKPPIPPAANTGAPPAPPPANPTGGTVDHLAVWEALRARGDFVRASQYYLNNQVAIVAAQKARG